MTLRVAALTAASLWLVFDAHALSFEDRWSSLYADHDVPGDAVSAKAEMLPRAERAKTIERPRAQRHRAARHRVSSRGERSRAERRREWYKGGKKWHYVYATKKRKRG